MHTEMLRNIEGILSIELLTLFDPIAVSPDGTQLVVAVQSYSRKRVGAENDTYLPTGLAGLQEGSEIWIINVQSGESRNLTPNWGRVIDLPGLRMEKDWLFIPISIKQPNCGYGRSAKMNRGSRVMSGFSRFCRWHSHRSGPLMEHVLSLGCIQQRRQMKRHLQTRKRHR